MVKNEINISAKFLRHAKRDTKTKFDNFETGIVHAHVQHKLDPDKGQSHIKMYE